MENITDEFNDQYIPEKALLIYRCHRKTESHKASEESIYVESYDIAANGKPINAHPLSQKEMITLSELFQSSKEFKNSFLNSKGLLPTNILHLNTQGEGTVCWYTPPRKVNMLFTASLGIPSGQAFVPAMIWKATKQHLSVFAIKGNKKPLITTPIYYAPLFNVNDNGNVCMGNVNVEIPADCLLEDFIKHWEDYFWNSYFSHMMEGFNPVKGNPVLLWKELVGTEKEFPITALKKSNRTLQNLL